MFEQQYNEEMETEVKRLEAKARAAAVGKPDWQNACAVCGCELATVDFAVCDQCRGERD